MKYGLVSKNVLTFLLLVVVTTGYTQDGFRWKQDSYTSFKNITVNDGLSSNLILNIVQDSFGIMWFATGNGLTRYDGHDFTVYQTSKENEHSLSDNFITSLAEDVDGNLWIGTRNGLNRYDRKQNRFIRYLADINNRNSPKSNDIKALHAGKEGFLWVESSYGLSRLNIKDGTWTHRHHTVGVFEGDYFYHFILEDSNNNLWMGGRGLLLTRVPNKNIDTALITLPIWHASSCVEDLNGDIYLGNYDHLITRYNPQKNNIDTITAIDVAVLASICDKEGKLWLGGDGGINILDLNRREMTWIQYNPSNPQSIASNKVLCIYKDRYDCIWIGTDKGISMYSPHLNIFRHYRQINKLSNGMTSNAITALLQDKDGLLWIGTAENGVDTLCLDTEEFGNITYNLLTHNLDKKTFDKENYVLRQYLRHKVIKSLNANLKENDIFQDYQHFRQSPLQFISRNENRVSSLYQDREGTIYIGLWTHMGFNTYNKKQKELKRYALWGLPPYVHGPFILEGNLFGANWYNDFLEDNQGNLWCATWEAIGLNLFDRKKGEFSPKHYIPGYFPRKYLRLNFLNDSSRQRIIVGDGAHYGYYSLKSKSFSRYSPPLSDSYVNSDILNKYAKYSDLIYNSSMPMGFQWRKFILYNDIIWIVGFDMLIKHTLATDTFEVIERYNDGENKIAFAVGTQNQNIWMSRDKLLKQINTQTNKVYPITTFDETITALHEDLTGLLWIGTKKGIYHYDTKNDKLSFSNIGIIEVQAITEDHKGNIYVAGSTGLTELDKLAIVAQYPFTYPDPNGFPGSTITVLYVSSNKTYIWIGTNDGLAKLNVDTKEVVAYVNDPKDKFSLLRNHIIDLCEDANSDLWISTDFGICMLEHDSGKFIDLSIPDDRTITSRLTSYLMQDHLDNIWIGTTEDGISVLDPKTDRFRHYSHQTWDENSLSDNYIYFILQDSRYNIWLCTRKGLNKYNPAEDNFNRIDGLDDYHIYNMQEDNSGKLWISTNNGLLCLDSSGQIIRKYQNFPGLQGNEFSMAGCKLNNGDFAFGGDAGFNIFNPVNLANNQFKPKPIIFSNLIVKDSVRYFDLNGLETISLDYSDNTFSISFCSTDYEYSDMISYRYKLDGFDDSWSYTEAPILTAKYNGIPYGNHTFTVEVSNCFGEWVGVERSLAIQIATPWYYQWWFFTLIILLFAGAIYAIIRIRERQLKLENIRLESIVEDRTSELKDANQKLIKSEKELRAMNDSKNKFFSIISHDLRNPLKALNLTTRSLYEQYEQLSEEEKYNIISIIHKTTHQTGMLLENLLTWVVSQMNLLKPNLKKTDLSSLLESNLEFMQIEAQKKNIRLAGNVPPETYVWADGNLLSTIFRNLISNAIHYSFSGSEITVAAKEKNNVIEVAVTDKGVGISQENLTRIFSLDSKIQTKGTDNEKGTGLGLIITQEFVHLHNGKIWVESEVGKGSIFIFTLQKYIEENGAH